MYENAPVPQDPWRDLRRTDHSLVHDPTVRLRGMATIRFARDAYRQALDHFDQVAALLPATIAVPGVSRSA